MFTALIADRMKLLGMYENTNLTSNWEYFTSYNANKHVNNISNQVYTTWNFKLGTLELAVLYKIDGLTSIKFESFSISSLLNINTTRPVVYV